LEFKSVNKQKLATHLDLANHHPDATPEDIKKLCQSVLKHGFNSAFVNPYFVKLAREQIGEKGKVGTVVGFPIGQDTKAVKAVGAIDAAKNGADELDISMNVGLFKAGDDQAVFTEMQAVIEAAKSYQKTVLVKFIIETGFLTDDEIKKASELVLKSGADFVKTCSGWGPRGAKIKDVELIKSAIGDRVKIKVAGGIHTYQKAIAFLEEGANRIGTSKAIEIVSGTKSH
jgi:deoxyribose-phosphate aldolase